MANVTAHRGLVVALLDPGEAAALAHGLGLYARERRADGRGDCGLGELQGRLVAAIASARQADLGAVTSSISSPISSNDGIRGNGASMSTTQAADRLGITRRRASQLVASQELPAHRVGSRWRIFVDDLAEYQRDRE